MGHTDSLHVCGRVLPSEGSHATFAPRGWKQRALQEFVERELGHCEVEHVRLGSSVVYVTLALTVIIVHSDAPIWESPWTMWSCMRWSAWNKSGTESRCRIVWSCEQVGCGSGLERIYRFLQSDLPCLRPGVNMKLNRVDICPSCFLLPNVAAILHQRQMGALLFGSVVWQRCTRLSHLSEWSSSIVIQCLTASWQDAPSISQAALDESDPLAVEAVDMFLSIVGAEAGYMGLRLLASGGIYICGGIAPKVITWPTQESQPQFHERI